MTFLLHLKSQLKNLKKKEHLLFEPFWQVFWKKEKKTETMNSGLLFISVSVQNTLSLQSECIRIWFHPYVVLHTEPDGAVVIMLVVALSLMKIWKMKETTLLLVRQ